jgi:hypothetical protein
MQISLSDTYASAVLCCVPERRAIRPSLFQFRNRRYEFVGDKTSILVFFRFPAAKYPKIASRGISAIFTPFEGNVGIGFAILINTARKAMDQLIAISEHEQKITNARKSKQYADLSGAAWRIPDD